MTTYNTKQEILNVCKTAGLSRKGLNMIYVSMDSEKQITVSYAFGKDYILNEEARKIMKSLIKTFHNEETNVTLILE